MKYQFTIKNLNAKNTVLRKTGVEFVIHEVQIRDLFDLDRNAERFNDEFFPLKIDEAELQKQGFALQEDPQFGEYYSNPNCFWPIRKSGNHFVFFHWDEDISTIKHLVKIKYLHQLQQAVAALTDFEIIK